MDEFKVEVIVKRFLIIISVVVVLGLLIGGAYTTMNLLRAAEPERIEPGGGKVLSSVQVGNDGVPVSVQTTIFPAEELPDSEAAASGIITARQDDSLIVGTGDIELAVEVAIDGATGKEKTSVVPSTNGPELEVVLTKDTILYRDITDIAGQTPDKSGEVTIRQELVPVSNSSEIKEQMEVQVWGQHRGDRIVADVLVFGPLAGGAFD